MTSFLTEDLKKIICITNITKNNCITWFASINNLKKIELWLCHIKHFVV